MDSLRVVWEFSKCKWKVSDGGEGEVGSHEERSGRARRKTENGWIL